MKLVQGAKMPPKVWSDKSHDKGLKTPDPEFEAHQHPINRNRMRHRGKDDDKSKELPLIDIPTDVQIHNCHICGREFEYNLPNLLHFFIAFPFGTNKWVAEDRPITFWGRRRKTYVPYNGSF